MLWKNWYDHAFGRYWLQHGLPRSQHQIPKAPKAIIAVAAVSGEERPRKRLRMVREAMRTEKESGLIGKQSQEFPFAAEVHLPRSGDPVALSWPNVKIAEDRF